ncbi:hypothetical protein Clacol_010124 [Clathrus columnatus]|uniref:BZIP domain-containing protein n=1 Tax=Clathrus columnatus TaxID=1419009 RepID=A0AAV5AU74_9AGAM|nr:hypothetical protein Clacol_010124 [Clathrus columnatus]
MAISHPPRLQSLKQPVDKNFSTISSSFIDISPSHINQSLHYYDQDVVRELSIPPESDNSGIPQHFLSNGSFYPDQPSETSRFPSQNHQHVSSINSQSTRPRTPSVHLFTQHGLPLSLPPPPRTTFVADPPIASNYESSALVNLLDSLLRGSYSNMLANQNNASDTGAENASVVDNPAGASIEFNPFDDLHIDHYEDYLTSPCLDQSPEETPFIDTPLDDNFFSPAFFDDDSFGSDGMPPPFGAVIPPYPKEEDAYAAGSVDTALPSNYESFDYSPFITSPMMNTASALPDASKVEQVTPALPSLDDARYFIPDTPALAPAALSMPSNTSLTPVLAPPPLPQTRPTKPLPTGTRRGVTAASLLPLDAPTQTRRYITPSATSRKAIPAAFKGKKRELSEVTEGGDEDEEVSLDVGTMEAIEAKRRQNTQAARRSRQRKVEHVRELEERVVTLTEECNMWQRRAYEAENKLQLHGLS